MARSTTESRYNAITDGQIATLLAQLEGAIRGHRDEVLAEAVYHLLQEKGPASIRMKMFDALRTYCESLTQRVIRVVRVHRSLTPLATFEKTERRWFAINRMIAALENMPRLEMGTVPLHFFQTTQGIHLSTSTISDLMQEYEDRGLIPDPYAQMAYNRAHPDFARTHRNVSVWHNGKDWCALEFRPTGEVHHMSLTVGERTYADTWWVAGVPKESVI